MARLIKDTPWPVLLLVASFLCPTELSLYLGSVRLPPHRALLLVLLPIALLSLCGRNRIRVSLFDVAFALHSVLTVYVFIHHHGQADGLQTGGSLALDGMASFLVARAFVRDARTFRATAGILFAAVVTAGLLALPEAISGKILIHDFLRDVTGYAHPTSIEKRLGLTRAYGTFDHPIHLGTFCASSLALILFAVRRKTAETLMRAGAVASCALLGLSSAPMLSLFAQGGLMALDRLTRGIAGRVWIGLGLIALAFLATSAAGTRTPIELIATGLTLDPWTGFYRLMIWEHGLGNVWANPWLGIGLNDWTRPYWMISQTVDAFWLVVAMRRGLPALALLMIGILFLGRGVARTMQKGDPHIRRMAKGWMISLVALSLVACTVHFWNVLFAYFFFILGLGGWLAEPKARRRSAKASAPARTSARREKFKWLVPAPGQGVRGHQATQGGGVFDTAPSWPVPVFQGNAR